MLSQAFVTLVLILKAKAKFSNTSLMFFPTDTTMDTKLKMALKLQNKQNSLILAQRTNLSLLQDFTNMLDPIMFSTESIILLMKMASNPLELIYQKLKY